MPPTKDEITTPDIAGLKLVRDAVAGAPESQFDMGTWDCGTTACAIGWFCRANPEDRLHVIDAGSTSGGVVRLSGRYRMSYESIADRFAIGFSEVDWLFGGDNSDSRASFLARLDAFIAQHTEGA